MAQGKFYGVPLPGDIIKQLESRENNSKKAGKDTQELMLDNNRSAWVSLSSGVNVLGEEVRKEVDRLKKLSEGMLREPAVQASLKKISNLQANNDEYTNAIAEGNILTGGTLYNRFNDGDENILLRRGGLNFDSVHSILGSPSSYEQSSEFGFVPMMGLTNVDIKTYSRNGALRKATIQLIAHTPDQLSVLEMLYFRPGFTMFLEWGNTAYIDSSGEISSLNRSLTKNFIKGDLSLAQLRSEIFKHRKNSGYNYDALIGKVVNFSFTISDTGNYVCSLDLVSEGDVLDSYKTVYQAHLQDETAEFVDNEQAETNSAGEDDVIVQNLKAIKALSGELYGTDKLNKFIEKKFANDTFRIFTSYNLDSKKPNNNTITNDKTRMVFITLYEFLTLINKTILEVKDSGATKIKFNTDFQAATFITFPGHITNNPGVCTLPYRNGLPFDDASKRTKEVNLYGSITDSQTGVGIKPTPKKNKEKNFHNEGGKKRIPYESGEAALILPTVYKFYNEESPLKILLNVDYLIRKQEAFIQAKTEGEKSSLSQLVNGILADISTGLGGINDLQLWFDEDTNEYTVVDNNDIGNENAIENIDKTVGLPLINILGLKTQVTSVEMKSSISKNMLNLLSIGAAAGGYDVGESMQGILKYNEGLKDRYSDSYNDKKSESSPAEDPPFGGESPATYNWGQIRQTGAMEIAKAWHKYTVEGIYSADMFEAIAEIHSQYMKALYDFKEQVLRFKGIPRPFPIAVPIELSLEMRGIAGFKVGNSFSVNNLMLPERLRGKIGFSITSVSNAIGDDNFWVTNLGAVMYNLAAADKVGELPKNLDDYFETDEDVNPGDRGKGGWLTPKSQPWSAAFISYVAKKGYPNFPGKAAHTKYAQALRSDGNWQILNPKQNQPKLGDLVLRPRDGNNIQYSDQKYSGYSHTDMVVKIEGNTYKVIGGNVSHSVKLKVCSIGNNGNYGPSYDGGEDWVILMRPVANVNVNAMVQAAINEWGFWHATEEDKKDPQSDDNERDANKETPRGDALFARLDAYWAAAGKKGQLTRDLA